MPYTSRQNVRLLEYLRTKILKLFYKKDYLQIWGGRVEIGDYTYYSENNPIVLHWGEDAKLKIGKFCSIAAPTTIFLGGNHRVDWITTYPFSSVLDKWPEAASIKGHPATKGDVVIGNDVWIGYGATILSGVNIGDGAVIGARAVVTKNVPPYSIVVGNPARIVRKRFSDEQIAKLLEMRWWDWPIKKIRANINILCSSNVHKILEL